MKSRYHPVICAHFRFRRIVQVANYWNVCGWHGTSTAARSHGIIIITRQMYFGFLVVGVGAALDAELRSINISGLCHSNCRGKDPYYSCSCTTESLQYLSSLCWDFIVPSFVPGPFHPTSYSPFVFNAEIDNLHSLLTVVDNLLLIHRHSKFLSSSPFIDFFFSPLQPKVHPGLFSYTQQDKVIDLCVVHSKRYDIISK